MGVDGVRRSLDGEPLPSRFCALGDSRHSRSCVHTHFMLAFGRSRRYCNASLQEFALIPRPPPSPPLCCRRWWERVLAGRMSKKLVEPSRPRLLQLLWVALCLAAMKATKLSSAMYSALRARELRSPEAMCSIRSRWRRDRSEDR